MRSQPFKAATINLLFCPPNSPLPLNRHAVCRHAARAPRAGGRLLLGGTARGQSCSSRIHRNTQPTVLLGNEKLIENTCYIKTPLKHFK